MLFRDYRGFTALEIMVVVVVVSIVTALAVRPMAGLIHRIRMNNSVNALKQMAINARSQAVANPMVHCGVVFKVHGGATADSAWTFFDKSVPPNNVFDAGTDVVYQKPIVLPAKDSIQIVSASPGAFAFRGDGSANKSAKIVIRLRQLVDTLDVLASTGRVKVIR